MKLQVIGCGDAFGSGGRLNTCFHVTGETANCLIDCGATSLVGLKRAGVERNRIQSILITHFHADHCAGIPFFMLDAQFVAQRSTPLTIAGPPGLTAWYARIMEALFQGSSNITFGFELELVELAARQSVQIGSIGVTPYPVLHGEPSGAFYGYRLQLEGKVLAYTGDTEWTDELIELGQGADLLIAEAFVKDNPVPLHLSLAALESHLPQIAPQRLLLTHMSQAMLDQLASIEHPCAEDGMALEF